MPMRRKRDLAPPLVEPEPQWEPVLTQSLTDLLAFDGSPARGSGGMPDGIAALDGNAAVDRIIEGEITIGNNADTTNADQTSPCNRISLESLTKRRKESEHDPVPDLDLQNVIFHVPVPGTPNSRVNVPPSPSPVSSKGNDEKSVMQEFLYYGEDPKNFEETTSNSRANDAPVDRIEMESRFSILSFLGSAIEELPTLHTTVEDLQSPEGKSQSEGQEARRERALPAHEKIEGAALPSESAPDERKEEESGESFLSIAGTWLTTGWGSPPAASWVPSWNLSDWHTTTIAGEKQAGGSTAQGGETENHKNALLTLQKEVECSQKRGSCIDDESPATSKSYRQSDSCRYMQEDDGITDFSSPNDNVPVLLGAENPTFQPEEEDDEFMIKTTVSARRSQASKETDRECNCSVVEESLNKESLKDGLDEEAGMQNETSLMAVTPVVTPKATPIGGIMGNTVMDVALGFLGQTPTPTARRSACVISNSKQFDNVVVEDERFKPDGDQNTDCEKTSCKESNSPCKTTSYDPLSGTIVNMHRYERDAERCKMSPKHATDGKSARISKDCEQRDEQSDFVLTIEKTAMICFDEASITDEETATSKDSRGKIKNTEEAIKKNLTAQAIYPLANQDSIDFFDFVGVAKSETFL